jgi:hypothetical protein
MGGMTKTGEAKWRALIAAQEKSGLGVREFAEGRGLAPATMYWWPDRRTSRPAICPATRRPVLHATVTSGSTWR